MQKHQFVPHKLCLALLTALFAAFFAFAPTQEAQAGGFEIEGQLGWNSNLWHHGGHHGLQFVISPGYRIVDWFGIFLDQGFGGHFPNHSHYFVGQTFINAKFFIPVAPVELWGKVGLGGVYHASGDWHAGAFALKLGIGVTYDIKGPLGIGINFDYMPIFWDDYYGHATYHGLDLMVHLRYKF